MPQRTRYLRPEYFTSPDTAKASPRARLLYAAMWCWTDEYGVGETNVYGLLGHAFPPSDEVTPDQLIELLQETANCWGVHFFTVGGRAFFHIPTWTKYQTTDPRTKKRHPLPDHPDAVPDQRFPIAGDVATGIHRETVESTGIQCVLVSGNGGLVIEDGTPTADAVVGASPPPKPKSSRAKPKTLLTEDFKPQRATIDKVLQRFPNLTDAQLHALHEDFCLYWTSVGRPMADWDATWLRRMYDEVPRRANTPGSRGGGAPRPSTTDQRVAETQALKRKGPQQSALLSVVQGESA